MELSFGNQFNLSRQERISLKRNLTDSDIAGVLEDPTVRQGIAQLIIYRNPLRMNIPRLSPASAGQAAAIVTRRTPGSTPAEFVEDTDSATEDTGTPSQVSFTYRTMLTRMKITRLAQLIGRSYVDVFQAEAEAKTADFRDFEEQELIAADNAVNSKAFDGINKLLPSGQVVKMTTTVSAAGNGGATLTEPKAREAIDKAKGVSSVFQDEEGRPSSAILTSEGGGREFDALISGRQNLNDVTMDVAGGFRLRTYDTLPIFRTNVYGSQIFFNNAKPSRAELLGSTGSTTVAYFLNFSELWVEELEPFNVVPLATTDSQFDQADMRQTLTCVLRDTSALSALVGIKV